MDEASSWQSRQEWKRTSEMAWGRGSFAERREAARAPASRMERDT